MLKVVQQHMKWLRKGWRNWTADGFCRLSIQQWVVTPLENASQFITSCKTRRNSKDKYRICERKIAAKEAQICVGKIHQYFEQNSDSNNIIYHVWLWTLLFLKVSGVKVQTKIEKYLTPTEWKWFASTVHTTVLNVLIYSNFIINSLRHFK